MRQPFNIKPFSRTIPLWASPIFKLVPVLMLAALSVAALAAEPIAIPTERRVNDERRAQGGDQKPSSVLVYNYYTSSATNPAQTDTVFSMTNVNREGSATIHLFFVSEECFLADAFLCLTPNQTVSFLASDVDPGSTGYLIAVATDAQVGCPISFNSLIGSEAVKFADGRSGSFNAEGFAALYNGRLPGCNASRPLVEVELDGNRYEAAPRTLALDRVPSLADGNSTMLIVNSLNMDITPNPSTHIGNLSGVLFDDEENGFSFARNVARCQLNDVLSDAFPLTTPVFSTVVPTGRSGWIRLMSGAGKGVTGAVINFHPTAATKKAAFNASHNLHHLSYTTATLKVPVFPPTC